VRRTAETAATRLPPAPTLARWGLGTMVLTAGVHKLLDPGAWTVYVVDWLAPLLVVSPTDFMLINGYLEVAFGVALLFDRYTEFASFVAAASLSATCVYLAIVWATVGAFGDVLARDLGLAGLAWAVVRESLTPDASEGTG